MKRITLILIAFLVVVPQAWAETVTPANPVNTANTWTAAQSFVSAYAATQNTPTLHSDSSGVTTTRLSVGTPDLVSSAIFNVDSGSYPALQRLQNDNGTLQFSSDSSINQVGSWTANAVGNKNMVFSLYSDVYTFVYNTSTNVGIGLNPASISAFTRALEFATGTSGTPTGPGFVAYADTESGATKMHAYDLTGTFAALSSFDDDGNLIRSEVNIYAGVKVEQTHYKDGSIKTVYSEVSKVNPELAHRKIWIADWKKANPVLIEVSEPEAFETIVKENQDVYTETLEEKYVVNPATKSVRKIKTPRREYLKTYTTENRLRADVKLDEKTGKLYRIEDH